MFKNILFSTFLIALIQLTFAADLETDKFCFGKKGFYKNPNSADCSTYLLCSFFYGTKISCPKNYIYSEEEKFCVEGSKSNPKCNPKNLIQSPISDFNKQKLCPRGSSPSKCQSPLPLPRIYVNHELSENFKKIDPSAISSQFPFQQSRPIFCDFCYQDSFYESRCDLQGNLRSQGCSPTYLASKLLENLKPVSIDWSITGHQVAEYQRKSLVVSSEKTIILDLNIRYQYQEVSGIVRPSNYYDINKPMVYPMSQVTGDKSSELLQKYLTANRWVELNHKLSAIGSMEIKYLSNNCRPKPQNSCHLGQLGPFGHEMKINSQKCLNHHYRGGQNAVINYQIALIPKPCQSKDMKYDRYSVIFTLGQVMVNPKYPQKSFELSVEQVCTENWA